MTPTVIRSAVSSENLVRIECSHLQPLIDLFRKAIAPLCAYIVKICVFREAALQGWFSQKIIMPLVASIGNGWMRCKGLTAPFVIMKPDRLAKTNFSQNAACRRF